MKKICTKCGIEKDIKEFYRDRTRSDGYRYWCKECLRESYRVYREVHMEEILAYIQRYYQTANGKTVRARADKKYSQTPKGRFTDRRVHHKRRACMKNTEDTLTIRQWAVVLKAQRNKGNICGKQFTIKRKPTQDHIIPLSKGGGLTFENIQALCSSCNSVKNANLDPQFIQSWSYEERK